MVADRFARHDEIGSAPWFRDLAAWRFVARGYLDSTAAYIAFAVVHCTLGDILIGAAALLLALVILRQPALARWQPHRIAALTVLLSVAYTVFSEWMNVGVLRSWSYTDAMPTLQVGESRIGISPLLQWSVVPVISLHCAGRHRYARSSARA